MLLNAILDEAALSLQNNLITAPGFAPNDYHGAHNTNVYEVQQLHQFTQFFLHGIFNLLSAILGHRWRAPAPVRNPCSSRKIGKFGTSTGGFRPPSKSLCCQVQTSVRITVLSKPSTLPFECLQLHLGQDGQQQIHLCPRKGHVSCRRKGKTCHSHA